MTETLRTWRIITGLAGVLCLVAGLVGLSLSSIIVGFVTALVMIPNKAIKVPIVKGLFLANGVALLYNLVFEIVIIAANLFCWAFSKLCEWNIVCFDNCEFWQTLLVAFTVTSIVAQLLCWISAFVLYRKLLALSLRQIAAPDD